MLRNYLKTAIRSLFRHRFFSFINIFGLATAMTICMGIMMLVADQMMYDRYNTQRDRIFRLNSIPTDEKGNEFNETATTTLPVRTELLEHYTGIEKAVRVVRGFGNHWMEIEQNINVPVAGYYVDPEMLDLFQYELEFGDRRTALNEPYNVVLTKATARKLFEKENPIGETFMVGEAGPYKVTGVLKETSNKSHIAFEALASIATYKSEIAADKRGNDLEDWYQYTAGWVYILVEQGKDISEIQSHLDKIQKDHFSELPKPETQQKVKYSMQPLMAITPGPLY
jgi:putative ABC transport system permease protein